MIYRNGKLILEVQLAELANQVGQTVQRKIGAIHKGADLVWLTIYNAIKSCFGSGTWLGDKPWLGDDNWKNN